MSDEGTQPAMNATPSSTASAARTTQPQGLALSTTTMRRTFTGAAPDVGTPASRRLYKLEQLRQITAANNPTKWPGSFTTCRFMNLTHSSTEVNLTPFSTHLKVISSSSQRPRLDRLAMPYPQLGSTLPQWQLVACLRHGRSQL